ncbi:energy-coupling factor transporter transmembrane protein EcfT [Nakamurella sp. A5-74]|uniref:Energy-coupling factor transporter transmembrane protein EcfT n=1 Tax=Nakamurella sp. A5-74 TaxID=3158264 RepID=A0AAU8DNE9_9ACTN
MIGAYRPGSSLLHRMAAGQQLLGLIVALVAIAVTRSWWTLGVAAAATLALYAVGGIPTSALWQQVRPLRWVVLFIGVLQWITTGWQAALTVCGTLIVSVALAALFTLTTRVTAMLDLSVKLLHPLRRFVDPDRVGLVLAMTIRAVPLMVSIVQDVRQARTARGAGFSLRAMAVPAVVRALRQADAMGDALIARGVDD